MIQFVFNDLVAKPMTFAIKNRDSSSR